MNNDFKHSKSSPFYQPKTAFERAQHNVYKAE